MGLTISQLSAVTALATGDQIVVWSSSNGDTRKASLTTLLAFFEDQFAAPGFETQTNAPTSSGFNLQLTASTESIWAVVNPTGAFAAGTITLPPVADAFDGQQIICTCSQAITALTVAGNGATVSGEPTSLAADGAFVLRYNLSSTTWVCISGGNTFTNLIALNVIADEVSATSGVITTVNTEKVNFDPTTVASLTGGVAGQRKFVTDSNAAMTAGIGAVVAGGGANIVPVFYDGTNWRIG